jgi:hypothetical protein
MNRVVIIPILVIVDVPFGILGLSLTSYNYLIFFVTAILISYRIKIFSLPFDILVKQAFHLLHRFFLSYWLYCNY